jgi:hypothetical protein
LAGQWGRAALERFDTSEDSRGLVERTERYFAKETKIAERTSKRLESLREKL